MKKSKLWVLNLLVFFALFNTSCQKDIETTDPGTQQNESELVRSVVSSLNRNNQQQTNPAQSQAQTQSAINSYLCFEFVYPISIIYNDGSTLSLADDAEFAQAIVSQTNQHFIINFVYPFDVIKDGNIISVTSDADFENLINSCQTFNMYILSPTQTYCFDFVYPVDIEMSDGSVATVHDASEFDLLFANASANYYPVNMVYPFEVDKDGQIITIHNSVEFETLIDSCFGGNVCPDGLLIPSDWFACLSLNYPIDLLYNDGSTVTVNNDREYDDALYNSTVNHYVEDFVYDIIVLENGNVHVVHNIQEFYDLYMNCFTGGAIAYTDSLCFDFVYPLQVLDFSGNATTVNNNTELNDFMEQLYPNGNQFPFIDNDFVYPVQIVYNGTTFTLNDINDYYSAINTYCNPSNP